MQLRIRTCGRAEQWEHALDLLVELPRLQVPGTVFAFNAAIGACENAGEWQQAVHLLASWERVPITCLFVLGSLTRKQTARSLGSL